MKTIDYISDPHWDIYFSSSSPMKIKNLDKYFEKYFSKKNSDTLIIAGDTGHYPVQDLFVMNYLKEHYKNILIVMGNHNLYNVSADQRYKFKHWKDKFEFQKNLFQESGIIVLDGDIAEIDGVKIGGSMGWYDGSYYYAYGGFSPYGESLLSFWKRYMNDFHRIPCLQDFTDIWVQEKMKIDKVLDLCDVMVTHFQPSISHAVFHPDYHYNNSNAFYSFNYDEQLESLKTTKFWVYGHTHNRMEVQYTDSLKLLCNPFGYKDENGEDAFVRSFTV